MKHFSLLLVIFCLLWGCKASEIEGPAGAAGTTGATGATGANGQDGQDGQDGSWSSGGGQVYTRLGV